MKNICINLEIEEDKYEKFMTVIDKAGVKLDNICKEIVDKTVSDNNIDWLKGSISGEVKSKDVKANKAISIFTRKGYHNILRENTTFSTKNKNNGLYWLNPDKKHLKEDWYIILNDCSVGRLYLLYVPANSIDKLKMRNDKICNVSIYGLNLEMKDVHSGVKFGKYLIDFVEYDSLV